MFILKKGHQPGVYVLLRALFLVINQLVLRTVSKLSWKHISVQVLTTLHQQSCHCKQHPDKYRTVDTFRNMIILVTLYMQY